ncbi:MAG TPA: spore protease YyaC [Tissierellales bacterium]|nr:spore protease YyaC [Tissierellales bacterium]
MNISTRTDSVDSKSTFAIYNFSNFIYDYTHYNYGDKHDKFIIMCIGTDRSTGDALGPLVGYKLKPIISEYKDVELLGTLDDPIHAKNLSENIKYINTNFHNPFILAIDASLGSYNKIGHINIKESPLKPGLGVNKNLPKVGDISITGVVNISGIMEYAVLQNTRLSLVMNMADIISKSLNIALWMLHKDKKEKKNINNLY